MVFSHHVFIDAPDPAWLQIFSQTASLGNVFPSGLTLMTIMMYIFRSRMKWNITLMFILWGLQAGHSVVLQYLIRWWGTNVYLHNTLNIVGHIHLVLLMGSVLLAFGLTYSILPSITGKTLSRKLGVMHLILTNIGGFGLAFLFLFLGFAGFIRREGDIPSEFAWAMPWLMFFALIVGFGQIVFAYNFFQTLKRKTKTSDEEQFGEDQRKESVKEQNSYINEQGDIVNTELLLQGIEEVAKTIRTNEGAINKIVEGQKGRGHLFWHTDTIHKEFYYAQPYLLVWRVSYIFYLVQYFNGFDSNMSIFFVVTGIAQLFWVIPLIRGWGSSWYILGSVGTVALIVLFLKVSYDWVFVEFYFVTGIAQLFWVIPLIRGWGKLWYILGSVVTVALIVSWVSTNAPLPVKGVVAPYDVMSIAIETSQVVFIAAAMSIIVGEIQSKRKD